MYSKILTLFYVFFLYPDYVAARSLRSLRSNKAETHDATNRSDTSLRQVASSALLMRQVACPCFVAATCRTNSTQFEFVRQIAATNSVAATMIFTCHTRRFVASTCRGDVSQRFVASCVSAYKDWRIFNATFIIRNITALLLKTDWLEVQTILQPLFLQLWFSRISRALLFIDFWSRGYC